ncbi:hypothetical protein IVB43_00005 [Bradyrhizobium sp. 48]|uniref:hypothetical protein n=1 Tax=Bradyrhizobium sp. 48 TaxID=2782676 RepID=UPI001FF7D47A|nr:hypothetical protein [Bradyrhizobium sp. 48]MCK1440800.1 hypothetical protein [Bradyrhizobium sp. 48]
MTDQKTDFEKRIAAAEQEAADEVANTERLAHAFLAGELRTSDDGKLSHSYLTPGSAQELAAQAALVQLLRSSSPLSSAIRHRLAALLDPSSRWEARKLAMKNRTGGKQPNHVVDLEIARDVAAEVVEGLKVEAAVAGASHRYGVSESTVWRAWKDHGEFWQRLLDRRTVN